MTDLLSRLKELHGKATPGPWADMKDRYNQAMERDHKRRKRWWHGTRDGSTAVECIARDIYHGEPIDDERIPAGPDWWDMQKVIGLRWSMFPKRTTAIIEGFFRQEDKDLLIALRNAWPAVETYILALEAEREATRSNEFEALPSLRKATDAARKAVRG